jgi:hypothetical protein
MKDELEILIRNWLLTLTYKGGQIASSIVTSQADKPEEKDFIVINFKNPAQNPNYGLGKAFINEGDGQIFYSIDMDVDNVREKINKIPDLIFDGMRKDHHLGKTVPGNVWPVRIETGMYEMRTTEGYFFLMSRIDFHYKGRWIPPENV